MQYLLDTNIINKLIDGVMAVDELPSNAEYVATHIQIDELNATSDEERRARLFLQLTKLRVNLLPTETVIFGTSRFDNAKFGEGKVYCEIKTKLDAKNGARRNNIQDSLIAEVAIVNKYTLITADRDLAQVAIEMGCKVIMIENRYNRVL